MRLIGSLALSTLIAASTIARAQDPSQPAKTVVPANLSGLAPAVRRLSAEGRESRVEPRRSWRLGKSGAGLRGEPPVAGGSLMLSTCGGTGSRRYPMAVSSRRRHTRSRRLRTGPAEATDPGDGRSSLAPAQQRLGLALLATGELETALTAFHRLIELLPSSPAGKNSTRVLVVSGQKPGGLLDLSQLLVPSCFWCLGLVLTWMC